MTKSYSRVPAASVLVAAVALAILYLFTWNRIAGANASSRALNELEALIATDHADANIWDAYGHKLHELKRYDRAIAAYRKALELEPLHREARIHCAIALVQSGDRDGAFAHMSHLVLADPKLAEDLFELPELRPCLAEPRFASLAKEAHIQAMD
jgi:tetratricopeptide (TPR) repeat protein